MSPAPGIPNFRDAGDLASGSLRRGLVYRSSRLSRMTPADKAAFLELGITGVFDLRTADEARQHPDDLPAGVQLTVLDLFADRPNSAATTSASLAALRAGTVSVDRMNAEIADGQARELMLQAYRDFVTLPSARTGLGDLLAAVADRSGSSVIHCTAGKDRTGWAVATLQQLAGVAPEDIVADYMRSNDEMGPAYRSILEWFDEQGGDCEALAHLIFVAPEYLEEAWATMHSAFGSLDEYLTAGLGLSAADVVRLRSRLCL